MTHTTRVERHILVDMLSGATGALLVGGLLQKSWMYAGIGLLVAVALLLLERETIEQEEAPQEPKIAGQVIPEDVVRFLEARAALDMATGITPDDQKVYSAGLSDGSIVLAQYVLDELKPRGSE